MTEAPKESSAFVRALAEVLDGARAANDVAREVAREAVHETLALVAADHPLDYARLVDKYADRVVERCCAMAACTAQPQCSFPTKSGKPCGRRAAVDGVCSQHLAAWRERAETGRRQQVYAASVRRSAPADSYARELCDKARKRTVSMAFPDDVTRAL